MNLFTPDDFKIFDIPGFGERMDALRSTIRPTLESMGLALAPRLSALVDRPLHVHVAKHARRTVNPPDDTWAAFGSSPRGYKMDVHFRVSVSRHCVRLLFEVGPEYYAKPQWVRGWSREFAEIGPSLGSAKGLAWFKDEHEEEPAASLPAMDPAAIRKLSSELTRRRDGQLVLGRRIAVADFVKLNSRQFEKLAVAAFTPMAPLFGIHESRNRT